MVFFRLEHGFEDFGLKTRRIHPQIADARSPGEAVVTYSRVSPAPASERSRRDVTADGGRREPTFDAAEVPYVDARDRLDAEFADRASALSAAGAALVDEPPRSGAVRYVVLGSVVAILAGVGVLAASVGVATFAPLNAPAEGEPTRSSTLALASPQDDTATTSDVVRNIPLSADEEATAAAGPAAEVEEPVAPPVPRPRPESETASVVPPPVEPETSAADEPVIADTHQMGSAKASSGNSGSGATTATPNRSQSPSGGTDQLIMNIEETLAKVDSVPPAGSIESYGAGTPPVLPPPASAPPVATNQPVNQPVYPPLADEAPFARSPFGPSYDVLPPVPVTDNGYAVDNGYPIGPMGPVPPEPVPYVYPPEASLYGEPLPPAEEEKPGIVKRTIAKTTNAVSRVFSRDN
jgi:hypothetical protein